VPPLGFFGLVIGLPLWTLALSLALYRRPQSAAAARA
jgi:hypothetical protein